MIDYNTLEPKQLLSQVEGVRDYLQPYGKIKLVYVTAEFSPYTSQFKPDLHFIPNDGPRKDQNIFIEFYRKFGYIVGDKYSHIKETKEFAEDYLRVGLSKYIIIDDSGIDDVLKRKLANSDILIVKQLKDNAEFLSLLTSHGFVVA